ncbi:MAG: cell division FtsZ family protein [Desulfovibrionaceae bacterium]|nr:cell division FtsZ family protein [Desulfovibrionaceae bacterium]
MRNYQLVENKIPKIKAIGVGNCGINAINHLQRSGLTEVGFIAVDTDRQKLDSADAEHRILLENSRTGGRGTGADPVAGQEAAWENEARIREALEDTQLLFILAGLGGGTGSGASPAIAQMATESGILTIATATLPAKGSGGIPATAEEGARQLRQHSDSLVLFHNNIQDLLCNNNAYIEALNAPYERIGKIMRGLGEIMDQVGLINIDLAALTRIIRKSGPAIMGVGEAEGENRAREATEQAISSPLQPDLSVEGARKVLYHIKAPRDVRAEEIHNAADIIREKVHPDALILTGFTPCDTRDLFRLTVIATDLAEPGKREEVLPTRLDLLQNRHPRPTPRERRTQPWTNKAYTPGSTALVYDKSMPESPNYLLVLPN